MTEPGYYPPPDFSCPPPGTFQQQQPPRCSSFRPSMWSWAETPSESTLGFNPGWFQGPAFGPPLGFPGSGSQGPQTQFGQNFGHQRHQGGNPSGRNNNWSGHHGGKKQKYSKEPEYSHFCDTCDRGFKHHEKYNEHISQHVKCSVPDCTFMAHEKIVSIHWKNNHAPGAKRIKLDTPEEIAKWREERRKNYPTLENIERKRKIMEMRQETGGVLETAQFGRMRGRGRGRGWGRGQWGGNRGYRGQHQHAPHHQSNSSSAETPKPATQLRRDGDPLGALACTDRYSDPDEPAAVSTTGSLVVAPKQITSALGCLMTNYGSMSESESDQEPQPTPIQRAKELVQETQTFVNRIPPSTEDRGAFRGSATSSDHPGTLEKPGFDMQSSRRGRWGRGGRGGRGRRHNDTPQRRRPTLLEMLLAPDIRHERNVLLQCVRYVVGNRFFGLESEPQNQEKIETRNSAAGEHDDKQEETPETHRTVSQDTPLMNGEGRSTLNGTLGSITAGVMSDSMKTSESVDDAEGNGIINTEETTEMDLDTITPTSNMYDDEIWESTATVF